MLRRSCRGFGRKAAGTRAYKAGEAGRAARYIARPEGIEDVDGAVLTNVLGHEAVAERCFTIEQQQEVVGFFDALEEIERATGDSHVYSHLILAMPYELGPAGRAAALRKFCAWFDFLEVPYSAALHKPDPEGSQRNFHAHVVVGTRAFGYEGSYSWSFDAGQQSELLSGAAAVTAKMRRLRGTRRRQIRSVLLAARSKSSQLGSRLPRKHGTIRWPRPRRRPSTSGTRREELAEPRQCSPPATECRPVNGASTTCLHSLNACG